VLGVAGVKIWNIYLRPALFSEKVASVEKIFKAVGIEIYIGQRREGRFNTKILTSLSVTPTFLPSMATWDRPISV
jgi:hypothetical protein